MSKSETVWIKHHIQYYDFVDPEVFYIEVFKTFDKTEDLVGIVDGFLGDHKFCREAVIVERPPYEWIKKEVAKLKEKIRKDQKCLDSLTKASARYRIDAKQCSKCGCTVGQSMRGKYCTVGHDFDGKNSHNWQMTEEESKLWEHIS